MDAVDVVECAIKGEFIESVVISLKPIECRFCLLRFADMLSCEKHVLNFHEKQSITPADKIIPKALNVGSLKKYLAERNLPTSGSKATLCRRLEGALGMED